VQRAATAGWATAAAAPEVRAGTGGSPARRTVRRARLQAHALIHDLLAQGHGIRAIARQLGWGRHTVQRYARAQSLQELVDGKWQGHRPSKLDAFKPHLQQRVQQGCINAVQLHQEVTALGFAGSYGLVRDYLEPYRRMPGPIAPAPPTVRQVTGWLTRHPDRLTDDEHLELEAILERCPELRAAADHIRAFGEMLTRLGGQDLPAWIAAVGADELPGLGSFATGLERDLDAVTRGLTSRWSSGPIEGRVNHIKMVKRQMFGRAGCRCCANGSSSPRYDGDAPATGGAVSITNVARSVTGSHRDGGKCPTPRHTGRFPPATNASRARTRGR